MAKDKLIGHIAAFSAYAIFGINIVACKDISNTGLLSPFALFTMRAFGASVLFWGLSLFMPSGKMEARDLWKVALASFFGLFAPQMTFLFATTMSTAIDISIMSSLTPIFTMFIAAIAIKEPITLKKAAGVMISFSGVLYLIFNSVSAGNGIDKSSPWGILLMFLNCLSFATYLGVFKPLISKYSVVCFMKWMFLFSLLLSLPFSLKDLCATEFIKFESRTIFEILFVIVMATFVAYFLIPVGQKRIRPTLVGMYTYLQPIIAAILAIATGIDSLSAGKVVATAVVISGVVIVNRSRSL